MGAGPCGTPSRPARCTCRTTSRARVAATPATPTCRAPTPATAPAVATGCSALSDPVPDLRPDASCDPAPEALDHSVRCRRAALLVQLIPRDLGQPRALVVVDDLTGDPPHPQARAVQLETRQVVVEPRSLGVAPVQRRVRHPCGPGGEPSDGTGDAVRQHRRGEPHVA